MKQLTMGKRVEERISEETHRIRETYKEREEGKYTLKYRETRTRAK